MRAISAILLTLVAALQTGCSGGATPARVATPLPNAPVRASMPPAAAISQSITPSAPATAANTALAPSVVPASTAPASAGSTPATAPTPAPAGATAARAVRIDEMLVTRDQSLALRDVRSGKERTLFSVPEGQFVSFPAWSPDGSRFLYVLEMPALAGGQRDWGSDLYIAAADGSNRRLLVRHDAPGVQIAAPSWSADGRGVLFTYVGFDFDARGALHGTFNQARRLDLQSGATSIAVDGVVDANVCPSGRHMVYVQFDRVTDSRTALVVAGGDGANPAVVVSPTAEAQAFLYPLLSPDCSRIVFAAVNATGVRRIAPARAPLIGALLRLFAPAVAEAHGSPWELWSVDVDGSNLRRLTSLSEDEPYPAWSADGRTISFLGTNGLYQMDADGSKLRKIGDGTIHGQIAWREAS